MVSIYWTLMQHIGGLRVQRLHIKCISIAHTGSYGTLRETPVNHLLCCGLNHSLQLLVTAEASLLLRCLWENHMRLLMRLNDNLLREHSSFIYDVESQPIHVLICKNRLPTNLLFLLLAIRSYGLIGVSTGHSVLFTIVENFKEASWAFSVAILYRRDRAVFHPIRLIPKACANSRIVWEFDWRCLLKLEGIRLLSGLSVV